MNLADLHLCALQRSCTECAASLATITAEIAEATDQEGRSERLVSYRSDTQKREADESARSFRPPFRGPIMPLLTEAAPVGRSGNGLLVGMPKGSDPVIDEIHRGILRRIGALS